MFLAQKTALHCTIERSRSDYEFLRFNILQVRNGYYYTLYPHASSITPATRGIWALSSLHPHAFSSSLLTEDTRN